jgi:glycosyltransferase involved in cell wall biosynthesis
MVRTSEPAVSVVIPCYNSSKYLRDTLESVKGQSLRDIEIILVDDGSRDGTSELIQALRAASPGHAISAIFQDHAGRPPPATAASRRRTDATFCRWIPMI